MRQIVHGIIFVLSLLFSTTLCACGFPPKRSLLLLPLITDLGISPASATSFCKCTCKGNSTIIALNPPTSSSSSNAPPSLSFRDPTQEREVEILGGREEEDTRKTHRASTCTDCNRKFCLDYKLPGCKGVREEEVFTTCFRTSINHLPTGCLVCSALRHRLWMCKLKIFDYMLTHYQ